MAVNSIDLTQSQKLARIGRAGLEMNLNEEQYASGDANGDGVSDAKQSTSSLNSTSGSGGAVAEASGADGYSARGAKKLSFRAGGGGAGGGR